MRVQIAEALRHFVENVLKERGVDGSYGNIICAPSVDGQPVLFGEEGRKELHVGRFRINVNHTLEPDVFV